MPQMKVGKLVSPLHPTANATTASLPRLQEFFAELKAVRGLTELQSQWLSSGRGHQLLVGDYVLEQLLGEGFYGQSYLGSHINSGQATSLRQLSTTLTVADTQVVHSKLRWLKSLPSAHFPPVVKIATSAGRHYLVHRFVAGESADQYVKRHGKMPIEHALICIIQTLDGLRILDHTHSYHGQLRPSKLQLVRNGIAIRDIALSLIVRNLPVPVDPKAFVQKLPVRHVEFMAPETLLVEPKASFRSDIYSLGCILIYLASGKPPFQANSGLQVAVAHGRSPLPDLRKLMPDLSPELDTCLRKMLAKNPSQRFESFEHCQATLKSILVKLKADEKSEAWQWDVANPLQLQEQCRPGLKFRVPTGAGRRPLWFIAATGATLLLGLLGLFWMNNSKKPTVEAPREVQTVDAEEAFTLP